MPLQRGVDIEAVAENTPDKIIRVRIPFDLGLKPHHCRLIGFNLGLDNEQINELSKILESMYSMFTETDAELIEINPLITDNNDKILALDSKVSFDSNALFKHPQIKELRDTNEEDPKEVEASYFNLNYIALDETLHVWLMAPDLQWQQWI